MRLSAARKIQDVYGGIIGNEARSGFIISDAVKLIAEGWTPLLLTMPVSWKGTLA